MAEERLFFDEAQWRIVEAAMARIIPTDDAPGAREAGTVRWLDRYLSGLDYIHAKPDGTGFLRLTGKQAEAWSARIASIRERYLAGIVALEELSRERYGRDFCELSEGQQDELLAEVERSELVNRDDRVDAAQSTAELVSNQTLDEDFVPFFRLLALHTRQAFYSDPIYGGNKDRAGWSVIGFDGPASLADVHASRYTTDAYLAQP